MTVAEGTLEIVVAMPDLLELGEKRVLRVMFGIKVICG